MINAAYSGAIARLIAAFGSDPELSLREEPATESVIDKSIESRRLDDQAWTT